MAVALCIKRQCEVVVLHSAHSCVRLHTFWPSCLLHWSIDRDMRIVHITVQALGSTAYWGHIGGAATGAAAYFALMARMW